MRLISLLFLIILCISFSLFFAVGASPADDSSGLDNKQNQIKQIETDLSHEKEQYINFDSKEKGLLDQLSDIEKEVNEKRVVLKNLTGNIQVAEEELKKQREALNSIETSMNEKKNILNKRLTAFYKYARRGYMRIFANANDLTQLNHVIKYISMTLDEDIRIVRQASDEQQNYRQQVALIEKQLKTISDMEKEESDKLLSLKSDLDNKVILLSRIHQEKEFYETAVKELGYAAENLKDTIRNLESKEDNIKENNNNVLPSDFDGAKGKLTLPLEGKILRDNKELKDNILSAHKGIYISGSFGAEVRSVFPGRVDYSGQLKGYGQVVVINHGSRFYTISAYLSRRDKAEGEMVGRGEVIGQVGETGLMTGSALYFEIRKGDSNLDPLKWLKVN